MLTGNFFTAAHSQSLVPPFSPFFEQGVKFHHSYPVTADCSFQAGRVNVDEEVTGENPYLESYLLASDSTVSGNSCIFRITASGKGPET